MVPGVDIRMEYYYRNIELLSLYKSTEHHDPREMGPALQQAAQFLSFLKTGAKDAAYWTFIGQYAVC